MLSEEMLRKHIKTQREECVKHEVNNDEFAYHWELLNLLCELGRIREILRIVMEE